MPLKHEEFRVMLWPFAEAVIMLPCLAVTLYGWGSNGVESLDDLVSCFTRTVSPLAVFKRMLALHFCLDFACSSFAQAWRSNVDGLFRSICGSRVRGSRPNISWYGVTPVDGCGVAGYCRRYL